MADEKRYKLTVAYDGHGFHGWQKQEPKDAEPLLTAQGVLETAVRRAVRFPVTVMGASRTDAGVHAVGQVASFTVETSIPVERLPAAINRWLPINIAVVDAEIVDLDFNPIGGATSKGYRYTVHNAEIRPIFDRHHVHHYWYPLDIDRMNEAARHLIGEHDFASFANTHHGRLSTVRTVFSCEASRKENRVFIDISGSGFLYHMVRIVSGTLLEVGRGHWEPDRVREILEARDRRAAGITLPPSGLCLMWIEYE